MYTKILHFLIINSLILILISCSNEPSIIKPTKTGNNAPNIIAHRGIGSNMQIIDKDTIFENTLNAVKYGFTYFDGVEVDIQMSKSGTIWLFHNDDLHCFDNLTPKCIPNSTDSEIIKLNKRLPDWQKLCTLEDVMRYQSKETTKKYISLDVKGYFKNTCIKDRNISSKYMQDIANKIIKLAKKYNTEDYTLVETDYKEVLSTIKQNSSTSIECYLLGYNNFIKKMNTALKNNYDGLSFNMNDTSLNIKNIKELHNNNLKIQIWTVNINDKKQMALDLGVDFIQSDVIFENKVKP